MATGNGADGVAQVESEAIEAAKELILTLTPEENDQLARASLMVSLSKEHLSEVWRPLKVKYNLPSDVSYDRTTGQLRAENG